MSNSTLKLKKPKVCGCGLSYDHVNSDDYRDMEMFSGYYFNCSCQSIIFIPQKNVDLGSWLSSIVQEINPKPSREVFRTKAQYENSLKDSAQSYSSSDWQDLLDTNLLGKK